MERIRVLVVDDHTLFRRGIVSVIKEQDDFLLVGEAADGLEAIAKAGDVKPDIILMDLNMPKCSGLEAIQAIQTKVPGIRILVLTVSDAETDLFASIKYGAKGYVLKNMDPDELVQAVRHVAQGGVMVSPDMATKLLTEFRNLASTAANEQKAEAETQLSAREIEVLQLVARGASNKNIAETLLISENTVKTHLRHIMETLQLANRSQAATYAIKKGLVQLDTGDTPPQA